MQPIKGSGSLCQPVTLREEDTKAKVKERRKEKAKGKAKEMEPGMSCSKVAGAIMPGVPLLSVAMMGTPREYGAKATAGNGCTVTRQENAAGIVEEHSKVIHWCPMKAKEMKVRTQAKEEEPKEEEKEHQERKQKEVQAKMGMENHATLEMENLKPSSLHALPSRTSSRRQMLSQEAKDNSVRASWANWKVIGPTFQVSGPTF